MLSLEIRGASEIEAAFKTANALGLTIPPSLRLRAAEVLQ